MEAATEEKKANLEMLSHHVLDYLDTRRDLFILSLIEKGLSVSSSIISTAVWGFFGIMVLLFLGLGSAIYLGTLLKNPAIGYFLVAGMFLIIAGFTIALVRSYVRQLLTQSVLKLIHENQLDENDS
jgi:hypothetical protein